MSHRPWSRISQWSHGHGQRECHPGYNQTDILSRVTPQGALDVMARCDDGPHGAARYPRSCPCLIEPREHAVSQAALDAYLWQGLAISEAV